MNRPVLAAVAFAALTLPACTNDKPEPVPAAPTSSPAVSLPATTEAGPPEASATASTPPAELKVGATLPYTSPTGDKLTARVIAHKSVSEAEAVDVRVCNTGASTITVARDPWVLLFDGGESEHEEDISGGGLPAPAYPDSFEPKTLRQGKCARGWINWTPIEGKEPYGVAYRVDDNRFVWKF